MNFEFSKIEGSQITINYISRLNISTIQRINNSTPHRYFLINKPRKMVSQFVSPDNVGLLGDINFDFPEGSHAIGRLDNDSEGLLIVTTNKKLTRLMFLTNKGHKRSYLVMVQNKVSTETFSMLRAGIEIRVKTGVFYLAKPEAVEIIQDPLTIYPFASDGRNTYPHTWLLITLKEGKFRQVRKMMMAIKHRCLRLIRISIADLHLGDLPPGHVRELSEAEFFAQSGIIQT